MEERRRYVRIPESLEITYRLVSQPKSLEFITKDISQTGIRFFVHDFIPLNSLVRVKVKIKKIPFSFEALAKVVWAKKDPYSNKYEVGAHFSEIPRKALDHLMEYIRMAVKGL